MWYGKNNELDYSQPIAAVRKGVTYLLLPQIEKDDYSIIGYNWFNIAEGEYNSATTWSKAKDAVDCYSSSGFKILNAKLELIKE